MSENGVQMIRRAFEDVKNGLDELRVRIGSIKEHIDSGEFVSTDMVAELKIALEQYNIQATALEEAGNQLSVPIGKDITEISNAIKAFEDKNSSAKIRELIMDYFRLTETKATLKEALEESKRKLMEKCLSMTIENAAEELVPYALAVGHVREPDKSLSDDDFDTIEDAIGKALARAVDRGDLVYSDDKDLTAYLDGSCELLASESSNTIPDTFETVPANNDSKNDHITAETVPSSTDVPVPEVSVDKKVDTPVDVQSESEQEVAYLPGYTGYVSDCAFSLSNDASASLFRTNEFKKLCLDKINVPLIMHIMGLIKLCDIKQPADPGLFMPEKDGTFDYLCNHGYLTEIHISSRLLTKNYLTLTAKGWACFHKKESINFLANVFHKSAKKAVGYSIPRVACMTTADWSPIVALNTAIAHEFILTIRKKGLIFFPDDIKSVFGNVLSEDSFTFVPAIFDTREYAINTITFINEMFSKEDIAEKIVIIVNNKSDISILKEELSADTAGKRVLFAVLSENFRAYDADGNETNLPGVDCNTPGNPALQDAPVSNVVSENNATPASDITPASTENTIPSRSSHFAELIKTKGALIPGDTDFGELKVETSPAEDKKITSKSFMSDIRQGPEKECKAILHNLSDTNCMSVNWAISANCASRNNAEMSLEYLFRKGYLRKYTLASSEVLYCGSAKLDRAYSGKEARTYIGVRIPDNVEVINSDSIQPSNVLIRLSLLRLTDETCQRMNERAIRKYTMGTYIHSNDFAIKFSSSTGGNFCEYCVGALWKDTDDCSALIERIAESVINSESVDRFTVAGYDFAVAKTIADSIREALDLTIEESKISLYSISKEEYIWYNDYEETPVDHSGIKDEPKALIETAGTDFEEEPVISSVEISPEPVITGNSSATETVSVFADPVIVPAPEGEPAESNSIEDPVPSEHKDILDRCIRDGYDAFIRNRNDVGMVILRALAKYRSSLNSTVSRFAYAIGDPLVDEEINFSKIKSVFTDLTGSRIGYDALLASAYIRLYFDKAIGEEPYWAKSTEHFQNNLIIDSVPSLREIVYSLCNWIGKQYQGLDDELLGAVVRHSTIDDRLSKIREEAQLHLNSNLAASHHGAKRIIEMRKSLFSPNAPIIKALEVIRNGVRSELDVVKKVFTDYIASGINETIPSRAIDAIMDKAWADTSVFAKTDKNDSLKGVERNTLQRQLKSVFTTMQTWINALENKRQASNEQIHEAELLIDRIKPLLADTIVALEPALKDDNAPEDRAGLSVLKYTLTEILDRINGVGSFETNKRYFYINLLRGTVVAVDRSFAPYIEEPEEQLDEYEFAQRVADSVNHEEKDWADVLRRIFTVTDPNRNGYDFGCAETIKEYLTETAPDYLWPAEYDIGKSIDRMLDTTRKRADTARQWEKEFTALLEMADGDDWFNTNADRHFIEKFIIAQNKVYLSGNNFGFYGRAMIRAYEYIRSKAELRQPAYAARLAKVCDQMNEGDLSLPVFERIRQFIKENRFGAANSYLQQVESGIYEIDASGLNDNNNSFLRFIKRYNDTCNDAKLQNSLLEMFKRRCRGEKNNIRKTGEELIKNWPTNQYLSPDPVRNILVNLGLRPTTVVQNKANQTCHVEFEDPGLVTNYPHPIANFGSKMYANGLEIAYLSGNKGANSLFTDINNILQKIRSDCSVLILANTAISLSDRRDLTRQIMKSNRRLPFAVLDRTCILYIAELPLNERWREFLHFALPFQTFNPYYENSSALIPPDMFIGRRDELNSIASPDGANLIYGGRQLGKSALLHRARTLNHHPENDNWAVYVDIKNQVGSEASASIYKVLYQEKFFYHPLKEISWLELIEMIEDKMMDVNRKQKLLLLIDECDVFLRESEKKGFAELDRLKRLQSTTQGRFKFVMAGLHNVLRLSRKALEDNSGLPQLQGYTIRPLSFSDARELLEGPLAYLGFTIPEEQSSVIAQILFNTNYFPGLVHFYASRLVQYQHSNANWLKMPPYQLDRDILLRVLQDSEFNQERKRRLMMTLDIDSNEHSYYNILAHVICNCCNEDNEALLHGITAEEIRNECVSLQSDCSIARLNVSQVDAILSELVELNILRREISEDTTRYMFSRQSFVEMLGTPEEVLEHLFTVLERSVTQ